MKIERRSLAIADASVTVRSADAGDRFAGYAAVFNSRTAIGDPFTWGFYEQISPGAFSRSLAEADVRMLIDHDSYYVVSRASAGTLSLSQDARGLLVHSELDPNLSYVSDLKANLRNGNLTGMSFGFRVNRDGDDWTTEEARDASGKAVTVEVRTLLDIDLIEVSAVSWPAYADTDAGVSSHG